MQPKPKKSKGGFMDGQQPSSSASSSNPLAGVVAGQVDYLKARELMVRSFLSPSSSRGLPSTPSSTPYPVLLLFLQRES